MAYDPRDLMREVMMAERARVFTSLFGGYEDLLEQPEAKRSRLDFICFTDDALARLERSPAPTVYRVTGLDATDGRGLTGTSQMSQLGDDANRGCTIMMNRDEVVRS